MQKFRQLREKYGVFTYHGFDLEYAGDRYHISFRYSIQDLSAFTTSWQFPAKREEDEALLRELLFHLGMAEAISYWKCTCSPLFQVQCGTFSPGQAAWWEKLFYRGLGEFMYVNGIEAVREGLVRIVCRDGEKAAKAYVIKKGLEGFLVPVGGGKDSIVSLELLKGELITAYSINRSRTAEAVIEACGHKSGDYCAVRKLDAKILEMNERGLLNGHIPFSAVVAFSAAVAAYLNGNRYIALSNEGSANESTVAGSDVNHQYSKSMEFEKDFREYLSGIIGTDIFYFSLLRPLTELQIACLFSSCKQYHRVFRSCNVGSKKDIWCCRCPKCLFVYIILQPFLTGEELLSIFGENLLDKEGLDSDFRALAGIDENKPFECVGTRREVLAALKDYRKKGGRSLLTDRYGGCIDAAQDELEGLLGEWGEEHALPEHLASRLGSRLERGGRR